MLDALLSSHRDVLILLARLLLVALYIMTGWQKMSGFSGTVTYMASLGTPFPKLATLISIILEFFACIAIALGVFTRPLALLLFLFTLGTALIGHRYWTMEGPDRHENQLNFFKNMSIMGGMLLLAITGAGRFALM